MAWVNFAPAITPRGDLRPSARSAIKPAMPAFHITPATLADAPEIAQIYAHHVLHGIASFEVTPPDADEIAARIGKVLGKGWPWLVAREGDGHGDGAVLGYAYIGQLGPREAYAYACEDSIYLRHDRLGQGIGSALLAALIEGAAVAGFRQMIALITGTESPSVALHARHGFAHGGVQRSVGWKHGQWLDVIQMQRALGEGDASAPA